MIYELLIKIGDSNTWKDGQVIATKSVGSWVVDTNLDEERLKGLGGYDSNWGYLDLVHHAVITVECRNKPLPGTFVKYRLVLSAETIASFESDNYHAVRREVEPIALADL